MQVCDWTEKYYRDRKRRTDTYKATREKAKLRVVLMARNPRCDNCGCRLQDRDRERVDYACVVLALEKLSCRDCVEIVRALGAVESEEPATCDG